MTLTDVCSKAMVISFFFSLLYLCVVWFSVFFCIARCIVGLLCALAPVGCKAVFSLFDFALIGCGVMCTVSHFSYAPLFKGPHFFTNMLESNILYDNLLIDILSV